MLLVKSVGRLNQVSSSKCQARRQSHQLSAQQAWVCAKQIHEGSPGHARLLGAGCATLYTGSSEVHEEMTELQTPKRSHCVATAKAQQGPRVTWLPVQIRGTKDTAEGSPPLHNLKGTAAAGRQWKHFHWQMKHFHCQML